MTALSQPPAPTRGARFRGAYGAGPLHLLAVVASLAIAGYALLEIADRPAPLSFAIWFGGAIVAHDLVAFPLYSLLNLIAGKPLLAAGERGLRALNHLRVPALLSAFAFVVWFPLILGLGGELYELKSGQTTDAYVGRWLLLTAALFTGSALIFALRLRLARRRTAPS